MQTICQSLLSLPLRPLSAASIRTGNRALATSALRLNGKMMGSNPKANQPDSVARKSRSDTPNTEPQSSASQEEHKTGDDHPAKQPDYQAEPSRSTGFGGQSEIQGGKEGVGARDDKQKGWNPQKERERGEDVATD
ncbi:hypothetical protein H2201_008606 [Coniosporium apollinis]|uniref:Succinate dehydrogenase assembly factor 4, mitochondrial n=2 Tax=Coniosporium TaxID=2810619 RepID=A0ABQ9NKX1_9PEZI|nr:hypothetical protein H2199_005300 [Cladosporium sp. JES 115]KAJ9656222.1 hypothetical protein H2201_008606 [Coniosporium apollinis]